MRPFNFWLLVAACVLMLPLAIVLEAWDAIRGRDS